jgi:copper homeostasis protein
MQKINIELCAASTESILLAKKFKFNRIELCQCLELGGLTPSFGLQHFAIKTQKLKTHVLIRPRAGDFVYNNEEKNTMLKDIENSILMGAKGIVVGALTKSNELDLDFLQEIKLKSKSIELTFHRAFDELVNWKKSTQQLIELQYNRILTAGFAKNVDLGFENLKKITNHTQHQIEIMVGGGVNLENIKKIIEEIKPCSIHFSGTNTIISGKGTIYETSLFAVNENSISELIKKLNAYQ